MKDVIGQTLTYEGTSYKIKGQTKHSLCLSSHASQELWVDIAWIVSEGTRAKIGRSPASLSLV